MSPLAIHVGDTVTLKKNHPCGGNLFTIMREGMDFRIRCTTCGAQIWLSRQDLEKRVKAILPKEEVGGCDENQQGQD